MLLLFAIPRIMQWVWSRSKASNPVTKYCIDFLWYTVFCHFKITLWSVFKYISEIILSSEAYMRNYLGYQSMQNSKIYIFMIWFYRKYCNEIVHWPINCCVLILYAMNRYNSLTFVVNTVYHRLVRFLNKDRTVLNVRRPSAMQTTRDNQPYQGHRSQYFASSDFTIITCEFRFLTKS